MRFRTYGGFFTTLTVLALLTTGCNYTDYYHKSAEDYASRTRNDPKMSQVRSYASQTADPKAHENRYFEYSSALSRKVDSLPGINTALVFLTDKNIYVGILTDWTATGTRARGGEKRREQVNGGLTDGIYNIDNGSPYGDNRKVAQLYNSYFSHKDLSDLSSELKQAVGSAVRDAQPKVGEVYISANREYVNQLLEFAKASWAGRPLGPLTGDFNTLVRYVFGLGNKVPVPLYEKQVEVSREPVRSH